MFNEDRPNDFDLSLEPHIEITSSWFFEKAVKRRASMKIGRKGTLSKHNVDESGNITSKCKFAFLQSFLNYCFSFSN